MNPLCMLVSRMKDNDLLVTELYRDPAGVAVTAISVYLTPKVQITFTNLLNFHLIVEPF